MRFTSSSQFNYWLAYFKDEPNQFHREDYYYANILAALYKLLDRKHARKYKAKDFVMKFRFVDENADENLSREEKIRRSKRAWLTMVGLPTDGLLNPLPDKVRNLDEEEK